MEEGKPTVTLESDARSDWRPRLSALLDDFRRRSRPETSRARFEAAIAWQSELVDHSLAAPGWPEEVGGMALSLEDQLDYYRAITEAGAPKHPCPLSFIVAPTIIVHGTGEQKKRFLERIDDPAMHHVLLRRVGELGFVKEQLHRGGPTGTGSQTR